MVGSPASNVAAVVVRLFGYVGGEERAARDLGVSVVKAHGACPGGLVY
jgi:hypothetical protein